MSTTDSYTGIYWWLFNIVYPGVVLRVCVSACVCECMRVCVSVCACMHCSNVFMYILFTRSFVSDITTVMFIVFLLFILPSKSCIVCRKRPTPSCRRCYQPSITGEGEILRYG